jgi:hypothetical protein
MSLSKVGPQASMAVPSLTIATEEVPKGKVFINGLPAQGIEKVDITTHGWGGAQITLQAHANNIEIKNGDTFITFAENKNRLTKEQLRKLIVDNLDNMEAITWISNLQLNRGEMHNEKSPETP